MSGPGGPPNKLGQGYNPGYNPTQNVQQKPSKPRFNFKNKPVQSEITPDLMAQQLASFGTSAKQKTQQPAVHQSNNATQNTFPGQPMFPGSQQIFSGQQQMFQGQQRFQNAQTMPYRAYGQQYGQSFQPATFSSQPLRAPHSAVGNPSSVVGNPPSAFANQSLAIGNPPSAFGNPPLAIGNPPSAFGNLPSAIGNPPSAFGNPPSAIGNPPSAFGNPPSYNPNNFLTYGSSNQTSINFHNMGLSSNISSNQGTFNQIQEPSITPQQNNSTSARPGDMFDIFTSSRTQAMKPQSIVAADDPFLTLRNKQGKQPTSSLNSSGSSKADPFGSAPFTPQTIPTASSQNDMFGSFPTSSTQSGTLSTDLFVSPQVISNSISSGFGMPLFNPAVKPMTTQTNKTELFGSVPFTAPISEKTKSAVPFARTTTEPVSDPFTSTTKPHTDMFGSTPFVVSTQPDKFAAFDSLSTPGQTSGITPVSVQSEDKFNAFNSVSTPDKLEKFAAFDNTQSVNQPDKFAAFEASKTQTPKDKYSAFNDLTLDEKGFEPMFGDSFESASRGTFPPTTQLQKLPGQLTKPPIPHKRPTSNQSIPTSDPFSSTKHSTDLFDQALLSGISGSVSMTTPSTNSAAVDLSIFDPAPKRSIPSHKGSSASTSLFDQTPFDPFTASSSPVSRADNQTAFKAAFDPAGSETGAFDPFTVQSVAVPSPVPSTADGIKVRRPSLAKKSTLLLLPPPAKPAPRGNVPKLPPKRHEPGPVKRPDTVAQLIAQSAKGPPPQPPRSYEGKKIRPKAPARPSTKRPAPPPPSRPSTVQVPVSSQQNIDLLSDIFSPTSTPCPPSVSPTNLLDDDMLPAPPLPKRETKTQPLLIIPASDPRTAAPTTAAPPPDPQDKYAVFKEAISAEPPPSYSTLPPLPPRPTPGHALYHYMMRTEPHCIANFDFEAEDAEELDFKAGDMIILISVISDAWFEGMVGGRTGMFPKNLVDVKIPLSESSTAAAFTPNPSFEAAHSPEQPKALKADLFDAWKDVGPPSPPSSLSSSSSSSHRESPRESPVLQDCIVLYDFEGAEDDELSLVEGQIIQIIDFVGDDWAKGKCEGKEGIFPTSYVDLSCDVNREAFKPFRSEDSDDVPPRPTADEIKTPSPLEEAGATSGSPPEPTAVSGDRGVSDRHILVAEYDFIAEAEDELQLLAGQEVEIVAVVDDEWLRGRVGENEGIFPTGFVPPLPPEWDLPTVAQYLESFESEASDTTSLTSDVTSVISETEDISSLDESSQTLGKAEAILDFETENDFELHLTKGDVLTVTGRLTETWLEGECNGATGIFPSEFIKWTEGGDGGSQDEFAANPITAQYTGHMTFLHQSQDGGSQDEFAANPCVADNIPRVLEREQTITNFDPEGHHNSDHHDNDRTPIKQHTLTEITVQRESGDGTDGVTTPSFSSSNPFADPLETTVISTTPEDKYSVLESNLFNSLDSFVNKENPFKSGDDPFKPGEQKDGPFVSGNQQDDPFMSGNQKRERGTFSTEEDPFESNDKEDPFASDQNNDPFKKSEDPFGAIKSEDLFESTTEDPFKSNEDPFAKSNDPFDNKSNNDPFNNKSKDLFSSTSNEDPFNVKSVKEDHLFSEKDLFGGKEDPFSPLSGDHFSSKSKVVLYKMRALYAFEPDNDDELAFTEGDIIEIIEEVNEEWLIGQCRDNEGLFPAAFAEKL